ncbi:MAG TPA: glycosyltransferase family 2 protein, partial [Myxococcota bacterium]
IVSASSTTRRPLISVFTPVYNEEATVRRCYDEVRRVMEQVADRYDWEHLFGDNHSSDRTLELLRGIAAEDPRVRVLAYSRNFGAEKSSLTIMRHARGDAVVPIVADLQDPPEMILQMIALWEQGNRVVYGVYENEADNPLMTLARAGYYWAVDRLSPDPLPRNFTGFAFVDRRVLDEVLAVDDFAPYIRGLIATVGFKQTALPFKKQPRKAGKSKHGFAFLFDFGLNGIISHSMVPLRLATFLGLFLSSSALLCAAAYVVMKLVNWEFQAPGIATVVVLLLFFFGINFLYFGIIGEYIGAIHAQVRRKPFVIVEERINFPTDERRA